MRKLSTTSYVILGLLSLRPWSTYELAQQMKRSLHAFWPRAESHLYDGPKILVAHGLARAEKQYVGKRPKTRYTITPKGRTALKQWLAKPGTLPLVEFEGLVKVLFADQGTRSQLLETLAHIRGQVEAVRRQEAVLARELAETGGPFPKRLHVNALVFKFMWDHSQMVLDWVRWAEKEAASWPEDLKVAAGPDARRVFHDAEDDADERARTNRVAEPRRRPSQTGPAA